MTFGGAAFAGVGGGTRLLRASREAGIAPFADVNAVPGARGFAAHGRRR